jgi:putative phage-type endonuclease
MQMAVKMLKLRSRKEWLEKRKSFIGGSEASCIVGMNPYQTNVDLWELKTGRRQPQDISDNPFVEYGRNAEEYLRELFRLDFPQYEVDYVDNNLWINDRYPFAHASLDGWLTDELGRFGVLEIKTTNILQSIQKEKWDHRIPDNYYAQVLWYMAVTEADFAILKAQLKYDYDGEIFLNTKHYKIERSEVEEDIEYLMDAGRKFAEHIRNDTKPNLVLPMI